MISPQPRQSSVTPTISAAKGHLVTKSSALATSNCKLETQFLTAQNMASHYKRVINAKKTIDNNPPKSLTASQKARDRVKREMVGSLGLNKSINSQRARSADPMRESQSYDDQKGLSPSPTATARQARSARVTKTEKMSEIKPRVLPNQEKLNKSMANLMTKFTLNNKNRVLVFKPETARQSFQKTDNENDMLINRMRPLMANPNNVEDKTKTALTTLLFSSRNPENSQGLHPALTAMSKLVAGHSYDVMELHSERFTQPSKEFEPRIKNRENSKSSLVEQRSCYQPPRIRRKNTKPLPSKKPLESERDLDTIDDEYDRELNDTKAVQDQHEMRRRLQEQMMNESRQSQIKYRKAIEKEEELKYLEFIKTVTDDILSRGISSNRVINSCFEQHIKRNKHVLDERKMRDLLESLRADIGVSGEDYENPDINSSHYQSVNKAVAMDRGQNFAGGNSMNQEPDLRNYLTLQKFGGSSIHSNPQRSPRKESVPKQNSNTSMNVWQQIDDAEEDLPNQPKTSSRRESSKSIQFNQTDNLFDTYENQIAQNIQSIRRNSIGNNGGNSTSGKSPESAPPSQQSSQTSLKQKPSILKKSPEHSRHNSNSGESRGPGSPAGKKSQVASYQNTSNLSNLSGALKSLNHGETNDADDDDDDVFSSEYRPLSPKKNPNPNEHADTSKQTLTNKSILNTSNASSSKGHKQSPIKDEYADDVLFNDNYGEEQESPKSSPSSQKKSLSTSQNGSPRKQPIQPDQDSTDYEEQFSDNDEDDDDTEKFDKLLKTKSFQKNSSQHVENTMASRKKSGSTNRSSEYDDEDDSLNLPSRKSSRGDSQETPRPAPRRSSNPRYQP